MVQRHHPRGGTHPRDLRNHVLGHAAGGGVLLVGPLEMAGARLLLVALTDARFLSGNSRKCSSRAGNHVKRGIVSTLAPRYIY